MKVRKIYLLLMLCIISIQISANTIVNASEIISETKKMEVNSEQSTSNKQVDNKGSKVKATSREYCDPAYDGNCGTDLPDMGCYPWDYGCGEFDMCEMNPWECGPDPIYTPETTISKKVSDSSGNGKFEDDEILTYTIEVTNDDYDYNVEYVRVRDSLLENLPSYLTWDGTFTVSNNTSYTGDFSAGNFILETVPPRGTVEITFELVIEKVPSDIEKIVNIVTDNGMNPTDPNVCIFFDDCDEATISIDMGTEINKSVLDESGNGSVESNEKLFYTVDVTNPDSEQPALNVAVRDSMLENLPSYLTWDGNFAVDPSDISYTGDFGSGTLVLAELGPSQTVSITYTIEVGTLPKDVTKIINLVTDNGIDPTAPDACLDPKDCDEASIFVKPKTRINKSVIDESGNGIVESNEKLFYTVEVTNPASEQPATNVAVRDSMLENLPKFVSWDGNFDIEQGDVDYTGDIGSGTLVLDEVSPRQTVSLTYTLKVGTIPTNVKRMVNLATDNGVDPTDPSACVDEEDCAEASISVNPETIINKSVLDESGDGIVESNEKLFYTIEVENPDSEQPALNVAVRDSMLENLPSYLTWDGKFNIDPSDSNYTGDIGSGTLVLNEVAPSQTVKITYAIEVGSIPNDIAKIVNLVTDNGIDPTDPDACIYEEDCAEASIGVNPETQISKSVLDESGNGIVESNEKLFYTIEVENPNSEQLALNVAVRDSMLENLPSYLTWDGKFNIDPSDTDYTGDFGSGTLVLTEVAASQKVKITYTIEVGSIPNDVVKIVNLATDNGIDPTDKEACVIETDCASTETPINAETVITKTVSDSSGNGTFERDETLSYTIEVINNSSDNYAYDVVVRDSMLENLPYYLTWDGSYNVSPETSYSGDFATGDFTLETVAPKSTVTITFDIVVGVVPNNVEEIINIVSDNGLDPINPNSCIEVEDCDEATINGDIDTLISKSVEDESGNGFVEHNEKLFYTIKVSNPNPEYSALNVVVHDSLLQYLPSYLTWDGKFSIDSKDISYTGDFKDGTFTIAEIAPNQTVSITYTLESGFMPAALEEVVNFATDDGLDPIILEKCEDVENCASTITPVNGHTDISKSVTDQNMNGVAEAGEVLTYTIEVVNYTSKYATDVVIRDSMIENTPDWVTFGNDVVIARPDISHTGSLKRGSFKFDSIAPGEVVTITYTMKLDSVLPNDELDIVNIVTNTGVDPEVVPLEGCFQSFYCSYTSDPLNADITINKSVRDANGNGIVDSGEVLTYTIDIFNPSYDGKATNVVVRDSMLENTPEWLTYNQDAIIKAKKIEYSGSLTDQGLTFVEIKSQQRVTITYSMTASTKLPTDVSAAVNIATINGTDPLDPKACEIARECGKTSTPLPGTTVIAKQLVDESGDGSIQKGEKLNYTITVTNKTNSVANDVIVRDSMLEVTPKWLTYNKDMKLADGIKYSGDLTNANLVIETIKPGEAVNITYSMTVSSSVPADVTEVVNIATDNGQDPSAIDPNGQKSFGDDSAIAIGIIDTVNHLQVTGSNMIIILCNLIVMLIMAIFVKKRVTN